MLKHLKQSDEWTDKTVLEKGFTLIELLVVIIILGILAAVVIFAVGKSKSNAEEKACKTEASTLSTAVASYSANNEGGIPADTAALVTDKDIEKDTTKYFDVVNGVVTQKSGVTLPGTCAAP